MVYSIKTKLDEMAYLRDKYKCVECDRTKGIEAHHIIPELEKLDNLITLCHKCHKKRHGYSGCFKKGFDPKRAVLYDSKGIKNLKMLNKSKYYNRWTGRWEKRTKNTDLADNNFKPSEH